MTGRIHTDYINDVCDALEKRLQFTEGMQYSLFAEDQKTIFAVIRALEVASEAVKHIPKRGPKRISNYSLAGYFNTSIFGSKSGSCMEDCQDG